MTSQKLIAEHLDLSQPEVSRLLDALDLNARTVDLDVVRVAYLRRLRVVAAGHRSHDGLDLTGERVLSEQVDRELKLFALAEKKSQLVNMAQLADELRGMFAAWRIEAGNMATAIKLALEEKYGIDVDITYLAERVNETFAQLARFDGQPRGVESITPIARSPPTDS